ncbi:MAG: hypothetical protein HY704_00250 [Gemmatimonadetes bacterium]|nr:hypothetical protein [Gemmatimonadota bacterium]
MLPWLYLLEDLTYEWGSARGTYTVRGDALVLSGAYGPWGPGKILPDRRLFFDFARWDAAGGLQLIKLVFSYRGSLDAYPPPSRRWSGRDGAVRRSG